MNRRERFQNQRHELACLQKQNTELKYDAEYWQESSEDWERLYYSMRAFRDALEARQEVSP